MALDYRNSFTNDRYDIKLLNNQWSLYYMNCINKITIYFFNYWQTNV